MNRCISVFLITQLFSSLQLFPMYSGLRGTAKAARALYGQKQNVAASYAGGMSLIERPENARFPRTDRHYYSTYADEGSPRESSLDTVTAAQDVFVQDEQWHDSSLPKLSRQTNSGAGFYAGKVVAPEALRAPNSSWLAGLFSQSDESFPQAASSRVDEAGAYTPFINPTVASWQNYEPEAYDKLNPLQKKLISEEDYAKFVEEYRNLKDVKISKFTYIVDGQPVVGFALLPKKAPESGKYPLVVAFRGGFNGEGVFHEWAKIDLPYIMRHFAFYAQNGYAVLTSQLRGADGNTNKDQFGGEDVRDVLALFDIARNMKNVDSDDVSLTAFSRGTVTAYKTLQALKDRLPIKSVVIKGGISDLNTFVKDDPKYIKPILEQARPDFNEHAEEICTDISLVSGADVLKDIPTLVMHNANDNVVPSQLSRNLIEKLRAQGTEHEVHFFPGKHHQILESNDQVQALTINWLNEHRNKNIRASL